MIDRVSVKGLPHKIAFIVPTKDHPEALRRMFASLAGQSCLPDQTIVVDGGDVTVEGVVQEFPTLKIQYFREYPPSLSRQRNVGLAALDPTMTLAGFLDDDLVLEPDAVESILKFWEKAPPDVGGARFNIVTDPLPSVTWLKSLFLLDSRDGGRVLSSGHPTSIGPVTEDKYVSWLSGGATIWRQQVIQEFQFDEWFVGTGHLEDVDYSYRVQRKYKLVVVADARVQHFTNPVRKDMNYVLGKWQIINRMYFVRKSPELSRASFLWSTLGMLTLNASSAIWKRDLGHLRRLWGNCVGLSMLGLGRYERIGGVYK